MRAERREEGRHERRDECVDVVARHVAGKGTRLVPVTGNGPREPPLGLGDFTDGEGSPAFRLPPQVDRRGAGDGVRRVTDLEQSKIAGVEVSFEHVRGGRTADTDRIENLHIPGGDRTRCDRNGEACSSKLRPLRPPLIGAVLGHRIVVGCGHGQLRIDRVGVEHEPASWCERGDGHGAGGGDRDDVDRFGQPADRRCLRALLEGAGVSVDIERIPHGASRERPRQPKGAGRPDRPGERRERGGGI